MSYGVFQQVDLFSVFFKNSENLIKFIKLLLTSTDEKKLISS